MARDQDFISLVRAANKDIWNGINLLVAFQREWNAMNYGETLKPGEGANEGVTAEEIGAVLFDTTNAFVQLLDAGHGSSMAKLL